MEKKRHIKLNTGNRSNRLVALLAQNAKADEIDPWRCSTYEYNEKLIKSTLSGQRVVDPYNNRSSVNYSLVRKTNCLLINQQKVVFYLYKNCYFTNMRGRRSEGC